MHLLARRFKAFVGVSLRPDASIENGIRRLDLPYGLMSAESVANANSNMLVKAGQRQALAEKWRQALARGQHMVEELKVPYQQDQSYSERKGMYFRNTLAYLISGIFSALSFIGLQSAESIFQAALRLGSWREVLQLLVVASVIGLAVSCYFGIKALRLYLKYRDISKDVGGIAQALLNTLVGQRFIKTAVADLKLKVSHDEFGSVYCHLEGGNNFESSTFLRTLREVVGPITTPRYLIVRKNQLCGLIGQRDYHPVPECLATNKSLAQAFAREWQQWVGNCELVYTRNLPGRKLLLRARLEALASQFEDQSELQNHWR
jgi:hypothetical protein